jgi:polyhydroxyalkanoate synthesis regulator phasin
MNMVELLNELNGYNDCNNETLDAIAQQVKDITDEWKSGEITDSEYKELLEDIRSMNIIAEGAAELNAQKQLNTIINTAITIASTAAKAI